MATTPAIKTNPVQIKDEFEGKGKYGETARALAQIAALWNDLRLNYPLTAQPFARSIVLGLDEDAGGLATFVKLTDALDTDVAGYYTGDVYGRGPQEDATEEDQLIWLLNFDVVVDGVVPQGFYISRELVMDVGGTETTVYVVTPQMPLPPDNTGVWMPISIAGVWQWLNPYKCDDTVVAESDIV